MAEELDDAEFWLPSHFLTDDDILIDLDLDFTPSSDKDSLVFGSGSGSDLDLPSNGSFTGSESDQDELLSELTRQVASSVIPADFSPLSKKWNLSSSPQSTLYGCVAKVEGSSRDSPNGPVSPPSSTDKEGDATTLDLLNEAAGAVERFKITKEKNTSRAGTGFFDCSSNKGQFCPPSPSPLSTPTHLPFFSPHHFPPFTHVQQQMSMKRQQMISSQVNLINKSNEQNQKNRSPDSPRTAWPPLQAQNQLIQRGPHMFMSNHGPKRECVGTGVFLPRCDDTTVDTRKKNGGGNPTKGRNGKGNNKSLISHHQRNLSTSKSTEIRLPPKWIY